MKKTYIEPAMLMVRLQQMQMLCSSITEADDNDENGTGIGWGGEGGGPANVKGTGKSIWDEEW